MSARAPAFKNLVRRCTQSGAPAHQIGAAVHQELLQDQGNDRRLSLPAFNSDQFKLFQFIERPQREQLAVWGKQK
jgi:hypothetical protein